MRAPAVSKWDRLDLAYADLHHSVHGHSRGADGLRCAARAEPFIAAVHQIEEQGVQSPLVRASLSELGEEYRRREAHWVTRRVSEDHPPAMAFVIGVVGMILPVALFAVAASDPGRRLSDLKWWPVILMCLPIALPSAWLLGRSLWRGRGMGMLGGFVLLCALLVPVLVFQVDVLSAARWWPATAVSGMLAVLAGACFLIASRESPRHDVTLPESLRTRICPDCGLSLDAAFPAIKPELVGGVDIGPQACPKCNAAWPLVPPPVGLIDRDLHDALASD